MDRNEGFYWVKWWPGIWEVSQWGNGLWWRAGYNETESEYCEEPQEIDEQQLIHNHD